MFKEYFRYTCEDLGKLLENPNMDSKTKEALSGMLSLRRNFSKKEERELFRKVADDDIEAANTLTLGYLWLVCLTARYYINRGVSYYNLLEEGCDALRELIRSFDVECGKSFESFARTGIRTKFARVIEDANRDYSGFPVFAYSRIKNYLQSYAKANNDRVPSAQEVTAALGIGNAEDYDEWMDQRLLDRRETVINTLKQFGYEIK